MTSGGSIRRTARDRRQSSSERSEHAPVVAKDSQTTENAAPEPAIAADASAPAPAGAQEIGPPKVVDEDVIHEPLPQQVPAATRTAAEIKAWLTANAKARRYRRPLPGYGKDQLADIEERAAKAMRVPSENFKESRLERAAATKAQKQNWNQIAKPLWSGRWKFQVVDIMVERTGAKYGTMYRALKRPK